MKTDGVTLYWQIKIAPLLNMYKILINGGKEWIGIICNNKPNTISQKFFLRECGAI